MLNMRNGIRIDPSEPDQRCGQVAPGGEIVQVYRPTPAGNIPKREKDAARDIQNATGTAPTMVPVRPVTPPEPVKRPPDTPDKI
jgi:hypothetical protein